MKIPVFSFSLIAFSIVVSGCNFLGTYERGNGHATTVTREVSGFNKISINGNFEVNLEKNQPAGVIIAADENLEPLIETRVTDNELIISTEKTLISKKKIRIKVRYHSLEQIDVSGTTLLENEDLLEAGDLDLNLSGAGVIDLRIKADRLNARLSGAGLVKLSGYVSQSRISLTGAGGLEAYGLETGNCTIDVSGIGSAKINVTKDLVATIAGIGGIQYIGHPVKIDKNVSGVGSIKEGDSEEDDRDN